MSKRRYKADEVIEAIRKAQGVIAAAARMLGCNRSTVYDYINNYATVKDAYDEANEVSLDVAEGGLMSFVHGQVTEDGQKRRIDDRLRLDAIKYFLSTKGKHRGFTKRTEQDHRGELGVKVIDFNPPGDTDAGA